MLTWLIVGLVIGFILGWLTCAWNATQPCPDCNEGVAKPCGDESKKS